MDTFDFTDKVCLTESNNLINLTSVFEMRQVQSTRQCVRQAEKAFWALKAIQRIFPCEPELMFQIPFQKIVSEYLPKPKAQTKPFLIRVAGQSGSGKSSQLVPAVEFVLRKKEYVKINVGMFAPFHPKYSFWQKTSPAAMREKTNGFALRALYLFYCYCIKHHVNVLLDMTLLEPEIEYYLNLLAKRQNYHVIMLVLAVPKRVSSYFIRKRQKSMGRIVSIKSANYFFNVLAQALRSLIGLPYWSSEDQLWLWSHFHTYPLMRANFFNNHVLQVFASSQQNRRMKKDEKKLLNSKKYWMQLFMGY